MSEEQSPLIDRAKIIGEVAEKHKVLLSEDDPIFALVALNQSILETYSNVFKDSVSKLSEKVETISQNYSATSKEIAEEVIGSTISNFQSSIEDATDGLKSDMKDYLDQMKEELAKAQSHRTLVIACTIACGVCLFAIPLSLLIFI